MSQRPSSSRPSIRFWARACLHWSQDWLALAGDGRSDTIGQLRGAPSPLALARRDVLVRAVRASDPMPNGVSNPVRLQARTHCCSAGSCQNQRRLKLMQWVGWRWAVRAWGRLVRLCVANPAVRQSIREMFDTPMDVVQQMGYGLFVGRQGERTPIRDPATQLPVCHGRVRTPDPSLQRAGGYVAPNRTPRAYRGILGQSSLTDRCPSRNTRRQRAAEGRQCRRVRS
jgi:hypothetical protein